MDPSPPLPSLTTADLERRAQFLHEIAHCPDPPFTCPYWADHEAAALRDWHTERVQLLSDLQANAMASL